MLFFWEINGCGLLVKYFQSDRVKAWILIAEGEKSTPAQVADSYDEMWHRTSTVREERLLPVRVERHLFVCNTDDHLLCNILVTGWVSSWQCSPVFRAILASSVVSWVTVPRTPHPSNVTLTYPARRESRGQNTLLPRTQRAPLARSVAHPCVRSGVLCTALSQGWQFHLPHWPHKYAVAFLTSNTARWACNTTCGCVI